jgi:hypothetical protein
VGWVMSIWTTRANETVRIGDLVALSVLRHADAVGRIVAEADRGRIQCELVRGGNHARGKLVHVEPDQLLVKVYR